MITLKAIHVFDTSISFFFKRHDMIFALLIYSHKIILTRIRESDYSPASQLFCRVKKTMTGNYHKLDLVNIDAHTKFGLIISIRSQDIERKRNSDVNQGL